LEIADVDCMNSVDIDDAVYMIAYIFAGGPAPCENCPMETPPVAAEKAATGNVSTSSK
jgi:hypothetical protein